MKKTLFAIIIIFLLVSPILSGETGTSDDETAIIKATMDYLEGWYEGNAQRMERALHEKLAKRNLKQKNGGQEEIFTHLTREQMVESLLFIDYAHLVKTKGEWKILNVLWENIPRTAKER